ncbi:Os05g0299250, partial [Oryza sativa Japonica Group]
MEAPELRLEGIDAAAAAAVVAGGGGGGSGRDGGAPPAGAVAARVYAAEAARGERHGGRGPVGAGELVAREQWEGWREGSGGHGGRRRGGSDGGHGM